LLKETGVLKVTDLTGKVLYTKQLNIGHQKITIPTKNWAKGIYLGQIEVAQKTIFEQKLTLQ